MVHTRARCRRDREVAQRSAKEGAVLAERNSKASWNVFTPSQGGERDGQGIGNRDLAAHGEHHRVMGPDQLLCQLRHIDHFHIRVQFLDLWGTHPGPGLSQIGFLAIGVWTGLDRAGSPKADFGEGPHP